MSKTSGRSSSRLTVGTVPRSCSREALVTCPSRSAASPAIEDLSSGETTAKVPGASIRRSTGATSGKPISTRVPEPGHSPTTCPSTRRMIDPVACGSNYEKPSDKVRVPESQGPSTTGMVESARRRPARGRRRAGQRAKGGRRAETKALAGRPSRRCLRQSRSRRRECGRRRWPGQSWHRCRKARLTPASDVGKYEVPARTPLSIRESTVDGAQAIFSDRNRGIGPGA